MRITIDIDEKDLRRIHQITGEKKKSPAIGEALASFIRMSERNDLVARALAGKTDYALTNDELEARDVHEPR